MGAGTYWTRRLRCPHCHREFDYDLIPGASLTALRLGTSRYMRCPLCQKFGLFDLGRSNEPPSQSRGAPAALPAVPRYSDRRHMAVWGLVLIVPAMASMFLAVLSPLPEISRLALVAVGVILLAMGAATLIIGSRPPRVS